MKFAIVLPAGSGKTYLSNKYEKLIDIDNLLTKDQQSQLLEIEIGLLELQDKYKRRVISLNSYLAETKRLEEKASKIN